ncbi:MAG: DUF4232 domain-containing protein, partial [Acidimicrobiia bacterium]|nr:DUF4232 domain-containing protein [Acidimicrobiia bacterium]
MRTEEELRRAMVDAGARVPGARPDARQSVARRVRRQRTARLAPVAVVAAVAIGFGVVQLTGSKGTHKSLVVTNPPATDLRPEPTTTPAAPATTVRPRTSADPCPTAQLKITAEQGPGAASHGTVIIVFVNKGPSCRMGGFPGVAALSSDGSQQVQAPRSATGFSGALATGPITPPTVQLAAGGTASSILEGLNAAPPDGGPCPSYAGLLVTPPAETESTRVPLLFSMCDLKIHPVVPGSDGGVGRDCPDYAFRPQNSDLANDVMESGTTCEV